jgi:3-(3-hydroxy-phenyl)propionate hydroxylase
MNIPLGGRGLNSGVHDAWNLTSKLDAVINRGANRTKALGLYDRERRTPMQRFLNSQILRNRISLENPGHQDYRQSELASVIRDDARRRNYLRDEAMITDSAREMHPA